MDIFSEGFFVVFICHHTVVQQELCLTEIFIEITMN